MRAPKVQLTTQRGGLEATVPLYLDEVTVDANGFITDWRVAFLPLDTDPEEIKRTIENSINLDQPELCSVYDSEDRYLADHPGTPAAAGVRERVISAARRAFRCRARAAAATASVPEWKKALAALAERGPEQDARARILVAGRVRVEWSELGEGSDGDYKPNDPDDTELLRFDFSALVNGRWVWVKDASYCTQVPVSTDSATRQELLGLLMHEGAPTIEAGVDELLAGHDDERAAAAAESEVLPCGRRVFEELSWISPDWAQQPSSTTKQCPGTTVRTRGSSGLRTLACAALASLRSRRRSVRAALPIYSYLDLSTAHARGSEIETLEAATAGSRGPRTIPHRWGAWVNVPDEQETLEEIAEDCPQIVCCVRYAHQLGCAWINFDADAETVEALPRFDHDQEADDARALGHIRGRTRSGRFAACPYDWDEPRWKATLVRLEAQGHKLRWVGGHVADDPSIHGGWMLADTADGENELGRRT